MPPNNQLSAIAHDSIGMAEAIGEKHFQWMAFGAMADWTWTCPSD
jgi:hypothetical protein